MPPYLNILNALNDCPRFRAGAAGLAGARSCRGGAGDD